MPSTPDLVIRNGTVVDGSGRAPFEADVAVTNGLITGVGVVAEIGRDEIDAKGLLVTPGFVDVHTHYDGQVIWSDRLMPSSIQGVTTVVMGNCGVGFAPSRAGDHDRLVSLMEGVEDIPEVVMTTGLTWDWETFPEYLGAIERRPHDIDIAAYIPHSPLRVYVMGERALRRETATDEDLAKMQVLVREALAAGALGFGTSRTNFHRTSKGDNIPSFQAAERELLAIGDALKDAGAGVIQIVPGGGGSGEEERFDEVKMMIRVARQSGRPLTFTFGAGGQADDGWRRVLSLITDANREADVSITTQILPRPIGIILGFSSTFNPFMDCPSFAALASLPWEQRIAELRKPEIRDRLVNEKPLETVPQHTLARIFDRMYVLDNPPNYEPSPDTSVTEQAKKRGVLPEEVAYDLLLEDGGRRFLFVALSSYADGNLDTLHEVMSLDTTILALGDGGAHYGVVCDASYPTFSLTHWTRDRNGERFPIEAIIKKLAHDPAEVVGLRDRGRLAPGYKADINVIDYDALKLHGPTLVRDMPGNGQRLIQRADGYVATIVSGVPVYRHGNATGALPGRLVRGAQAPQFVS